MITDKEMRTIQREIAREEARKERLRLHLKVAPSADAVAMPEGGEQIAIYSLACANCERSLVLVTRNFLPTRAQIHQRAEMEGWCMRDKWYSPSQDGLWMCGCHRHE